MCDFIFLHVCTHQSALLAEHFKVFDIYKKKFLVGEMIWNFADFNTAQSKKDSSYFYERRIRIMLL